MSEVCGVQIHVVSWKFEDFAVRGRFFRRYFEGDVVGSCFDGRGGPRHRLSLVLHSDRAGVHAEEHPGQVETHDQEVSHKLVEVHTGESRTEEGSSVSALGAECVY